MPRMTVAELAGKVDSLTGTVEALAALVAAQTLRADAEEAPAEKPKASRRRNKAATTFPAAGSTFDYVSKAGNRVEHTIVGFEGRGKKRRAVTDQGNTFPVRTLENESLRGTVVIPA